MIAKKSIMVILQNLVGLVFGFLTLKIVAVNLGMEVYGEMVTGFAVISLFSFIATAGLSNSHMKRISEGKDLGTCIGTFVLLRVIMTVIFAVAVLAGIKIYMIYFPQSLTDVSLGILLAVLVYYIFLFLANIPTATFDARAETSKTQLANMAQHPFKLAAVIFIVMTAGNLAKTGQIHETAYQLTWAIYTLSSIVTFLIAWAFFFYYKYPISRPTWPLIKDYVSFAMVTSIGTVSWILILNADRVMLNHYWGIEAVGQYFGVSSFTSNLTIIPLAVAPILLPILSHLDAKKDRRTITEILALSERHISLILMPITFFIFFFSRPIIKLLLADDWLAADFTLSFLAIYIFIWSLNSMRNTVLIAINRPGLSSSITIVIVAMNIAINFLFIPNWSWFQPVLTFPYWITPSNQTLVVHLTSHTGAAVALIFANLGGFVLFRYYTWKCIRASVYHGVTVKHLFGSFLMILALIVLNRFHAFARWYDLIIFTLIGLGIYLAVLYLIKEFNRKDLDFYLELMNPKGLTSYIVKELKEKDLRVALDTIDGHGEGPKKKKHKVDEKESAEEE
jgi:O-antigen/teichoic acid export membrane protein